MLAGMATPLLYGEPVPPTNRMRRWWASPPGVAATVLPLALLGFVSLAAVMLTWETIRAIRPGLQSRDWPYTFGTVLDSRQVGDDARLLVAYSIDGMPGETRQVRFGPIWDDDAVLDKYRSGQRVLVYYDLDSARVVLEPGPPGLTPMLVMWGVAAVPGAFAGVQLVRLCRAGGFAQPWKEYSPELEIGG